MPHTSHPVSFLRYCTAYQTIKSHADNTRSRKIDLLSEIKVRRTRDPSTPIEDEVEEHLSEMRFAGHILYANDQPYHYPNCFVPRPLRNDMTESFNNSSSAH